MKKLFLAVVLVLAMAGMSWAVDDWATANQLTVGWDNVTTLIDGRTLPVGNTVSYRVYLRPDGTTTQTQVAQVTTNQATITFTVEGKYYIGIQAVRFVAGEEVSVSGISWSDDPLVVDTRTFGVKFWITPSGIIKLKVVGN